MKTHQLTPVQLAQLASPSHDAPKALPVITPPVIGEREVIAFKPYSSHPDDSYLWVVARNLGHGLHPFVTHVWNGHEGCEGFNHGHYFATLDECMADFAKRGL